MFSRKEKKRHMTHDACRFLHWQREIREGESVRCVREIIKAGFSRELKVMRK